MSTGDAEADYARLSSMVASVLNVTPMLVLSSHRDNDLRSKVITGGLKRAPSCTRCCTESTVCTRLAANGTEEAALEREGALPRSVPSTPVSKTVPAGVSAMAGGIVGEDGEKEKKYTGPGLAMFPSALSKISVDSDSMSPAVSSASPSISPAGDSDRSPTSGSRPSAVARWSECTHRRIRFLLRQRIADRAGGMGGMAMRTGGGALDALASTHRQRLHLMRQNAVRRTHDNTAARTDADFRRLIEATAARGNEHGPPRQRATHRDEQL